MKILIDTNVIIDILQKREPFFEDVPQETDPRYTLQISVTLFPVNYEV